MFAQNKESDVFIAKNLHRQKTSKTKITDKRTETKQLVQEFRFKFSTPCPRPPVVITEDKKDRSHRN